MPKFKTINIHFSPLPKYRGPSPIQAALLNGDSQTGISIFILDAGVDDGPLLAQEIVNIEGADNYFTLSDKLSKVSAGIINSVIADYANGKIIPLPQDETGASHSKIITKADGKIVWNKSAQEIYNQFRAFYIWPGIWTTWKGQILKISDCAPIDYSAAQNKLPGNVLDQGVTACGNGTFLQIKTLQLAGKNETGILEFLNGYPNFISSKLD